MTTAQNAHPRFALFLRLYIATFLLFAAASKAWLIRSQNLAVPAILQIAFEAILGLWLFTGFLYPIAKSITIAAFAIFASVSAYKLIRGAASCGCFGSLRVTPGLTLAIDLAILASLMGANQGRLWKLRAGLISMLLLALTALIALRIKLAMQQ